MTVGRLSVALFACRVAAASSITPAGARGSAVGASPLAGCAFAAPPPTPTSPAASSGSSRPLTVLVLARAGTQLQGAGGLRHLRLGGWSKGSRGAWREGGLRMAGGGPAAGSGAMIEVEQKFHVDDGCIERVEQVLDSKGVKVMRDEYFDNEECLLTCRDYWLRVRDGAWELKEPIVRAGASGSLDTYREITEERQVAEALEPLLGLERGALAGGGGGSLRERLAGAGCVPFAVVVSRRSKYERGGLGVDIDVVEEPEGMDYRIGEVEVLAHGEEGIADAQRRIEGFMRENNLQKEDKSGRVMLGKVLSVVHRTRPAHFRLLQEALGEKYPKLLQASASNA